MTKTKIKLSGIKEIPGALFKDVKLGVKKTSSKWKHTSKDKKKTIMWSASIISGSLFLAWLLSSTKNTYSENVKPKFYVNASELESKSPSEQIDYINELTEQGYDVVIVDDILPNQGDDIE